MSYKIEMGIKKFFKVFAITFITGWVAIQGAGGSILTNPTTPGMIEASVLAGLAYSVHNWTKHRNGK